MLVSAGVRDTEQLRCTLGGMDESIGVLEAVQLHRSPELHEAKGLYQDWVG